MYKLLRASLCIAVASLAWAGCSNSSSTPVNPTTYTTAALTSDVTGYGATVIDTNLKNPWGLTNATSAPLFVANNHTNTIGDYDFSTGALKHVFPITDSSLAAPTGIVYNSDPASFVITGNGPSNYLFATENGAIGGLSVNNDIALAYQARPGTASYKGLAIGTNNGSSLLYAANFRNGSLDVFDKNFGRIAQTSDVATGTDKIPVDFAPFNVVLLNGTLYVTYAKQNGDGDDQPGVGNGYIDIFNADGTFSKRFASGGTLNSPWGMAIAPDNFGDYKGKLLVGNFGDGKINIYDPSNGNYLGQLKNQSGNPLVIDGLWSLFVTNGQLYYTAAPNGEAHGVLGTIATH